MAWSSLVKEMNNWIGPTVKHVLNNVLRFDMNTTAFCFGRYSLHLVLLKSYIGMAIYILNRLGLHNKLEKYFVNVS